MAVKAENGILDFTADDVGKLGYFLCSCCLRYAIFCTFEATNKLTGAPFVHIDTIPDVVSVTLYNLTYEFKESEVEVPDTGGGNDKFGGGCNSYWRSGNRRDDLSPIVS